MTAMVSVSEQLEASYGIWSGFLRQEHVRKRILMVIQSRDGLGYSTSGLQSLMQL